MADVNGEKIRKRLVYSSFLTQAEFLFSVKSAHRVFQAGSSK